MDDMCSLTPPHSPTLNDVTGLKKYVFSHETLNYIEAPSFCCKNSGYARKHCYANHLRNILESQSTKLFKGRNSIFILFGKMFNFADLLIVSHQQHLFMLAKKQFLLLKKAAFNRSPVEVVESCRLVQLRQEICNFLCFVKSSLLELHVQQCVENGYLHQLLKKILPEISKNLKELLLFTGRLSDIPDVIYTTGAYDHANRNSSACYHYYHLCLDLWWSSLEILHIIHKLCAEWKISVNIHVCIDIIQDPKNYFMQTVYLIIWDLYCLSFHRYKNAGFSSTSNSPFLCSCIKEFWVMLIVLLDKRHSMFEESSFYCCLHLINQQLIQNDLRSENCAASELFVLQNNIFTSDSSREFCLWLTLNIVLLYKSDVTDQYDLFKSPENCVLIIKYLIEQILSMDSKSAQKNEKCLRNTLSQVLPLVKVWGPVGEVLLLITDFYIKRIDDSFVVSGIELSGLSCIYKTSKSWLDHLQNISGENKCFSQQQQQQNSFYLYLQILSVQLQQSGTEGSLWRQLKGRIYSKFTPKRLKELSEMGLQNCFSVFLTVACSISLEEVPLKICELANMMQNIPGNFKKQIVSLKAVFAVLLLYQKQGKKLDGIASKVVQIFNSSCSNYCCSSKDSMHQNNIINLLIVYVDSVQEIFTNSLYLASSEYILIGSGFSSLLQKCGSELNYLLEAVLSILSKFQSVAESFDGIDMASKTDHELLLQCLFSNIFPFVERHALTNTPPPQLANIAAILTYLLFRYSDLPMLNIPHSHVNLFQYFGGGEGINPIIVCHYLTSVCSNYSLLEELNKQLKDLGVLLVQSWLFCCISIIPPCHEVNKLSKCAFGHKRIISNFPALEHLSFTTSQHDILCMKFFEELGAAHEKCLTLQEKNSMKEEAELYFKKFPFVIRNIIKQNASHALLTHVYKLSGYVILYCATLLYSKYKSDAILPDLIDILLFPHVVFSKDKFLPSILLNHIKENLPLFIKGIAKLDIRYDAYLKRMFKDLVVYYLRSLTVASNNPIVQISIECAFQKSSLLNQNLFVHILEIIKEKFFTSISSGSAFGFQYCTEILKKIPTSAKKCVCDVLLEHLVFLLLKCEGSFAHSAKELIKVLFSFLKNEVNISYRKQLVSSICKSLVKEKLAWLQFKVFRVLEYIAEQFPSIVLSELIPFLTEYVEYLEAQRGSGSDATLRKELKNLCDKVQNISCC